ncbi:MAG: hypothetical protein ABL895_13645 [Cyclobacteriaceae bacterium]
MIKQMIKSIFTITLISLVSPLFAQPAIKAIEDKDLNLKERYEVMKSGSQTYEDYKVIKEFILDGFWKITIDSISKQHAMIKDANSEIAVLKNEILKIQNDLKAHQASVDEITFESNHISVLGIPFGKGTFIFLSAAVIAGLALALFVMLGRMKILNSGMKEKTLIAHTLTQEFEEYKRKALEKQTKLSRELQNERNKIGEQRGQKLI